MLAENDNVRKPSNPTDFYKILVESVDEAIAATLGKDVTEETQRHLQAFLGFSYQDRSNIERLFSSFERGQGFLGANVPKLAVKKMYQKAGVPFFEVAGTPAIQYVYDLKRILASTELASNANLNTLDSHIINRSPATNALKSLSKRAQPYNVNLGMKIRSAVEKSIIDLLGAKILSNICDILYRRYDIIPEELPYRLDTLYDVLSKTTGETAAKAFTRTVARRLYATLEIGELRRIGGELDLTATFRDLLKITSTEPHILGLCVGPPGSGKSVLCKQFAYEVLNSRRKVIYMSTERSSQEILKRMVAHGWDVGSYLRSSLWMVDMYSWLEDGNQTYEQTRFGSRLCPLNATDLQVGMGKLYEELEGTWSVVILDSLSTLISMVGEERALKLLPPFLARTRQHGAAIVSLTSGIHPSPTLTRLSSLFDLVVEMRMEVEEQLERKLRISKFTEGHHPDQWIPYYIFDQGIALQVELENRLQRNMFDTTCELSNMDKEAS